MARIVTEPEEDSEWGGQGFDWNTVIDFSEGIEIGNGRIMIGGGPTYIASASDSNRAYLHDFEDGSQVSFSPFTQSGDEVWGVGLSSDYIAYGGRDNNTYVHGLSDGSLVHTFTDSSDRVHAVATSDNYTAHGDLNGQVYIHDLSDGSLAHNDSVSGQVNPNSIAVSSEYVAYGEGGYDVVGDVYVHDISSGSSVQTLTQSEGQVRGVAISESNIVYGTLEDSVYLHNTSDWSLEHSFDISSDITSEDVAISSDYVAVATRDYARIYNISDGSEISLSPVSNGYIHGVSLFDGYLGYTNSSGQTGVVDLSDGSELFSLNVGSAGNEVKMF